MTEHKFQKTDELLSPKVVWRIDIGLSEFSKVITIYPNVTTNNITISYSSFFLKAVSYQPVTNAFGAQKSNTNNLRVLER